MINPVGRSAAHNAPKTRVFGSVILDVVLPTPRLELLPQARLGDTALEALPLRPELDHPELGHLELGIADLLAALREQDTEPLGQPRFLFRPAAVVAQAAD